MQRVFDIALKDLTQLLRDRKTFLFSLIMPIVLTLLFGYAFGGFGSSSDPRLPVGWLDQDNSPTSRRLYRLLADSTVIRLINDPLQTTIGLEVLVLDEDLAGAVIVPADYGHDLKEGRPSLLRLIARSGTPVGTSLESEILAAVIHLESAARTAAVLERLAEAPYEYTYEQSLAAWQDPPVRVVELKSQAIPAETGSDNTMARISPGAMLQFAIAGLLVSASLIVAERKNRCLQRLLTTSTSRFQILSGHYLAIFTQILCQFAILIAFGHLLLGVSYLRNPAATLLVAASAAACIAALGLLIGVLARSEEQAIIFSLVPMFLLAGLGGAWVPLEVIGPTFEVIGHFSPVAWAMDGFKNVALRGLGIEGVLQPAAVLLGYALIFFLLAIWRFHTVQEK
jgi:ABC-2 type transport system permease protein